MEVEQQLPLDPSAAGMARRLVEAFRGSLDERRLGDLRLLVTELTANCVQHGGKGGRMVMSACEANGAIRVEVDCPEGSTVPQIVRAGYRGGGGGVGLRIVDQLTRDWGVRRADDRTVVWAELPISTMA